MKSLVQISPYLWAENNVVLDSVSSSGLSKSYYDFPL